MARITVEDCLNKVPNRFDLVLVSAKRARQLATGAANASVETENDKVTVVALREVAAGNVDLGILRPHPKPMLDVNVSSEEEMVAQIESGSEKAVSAQPQAPQEDQDQAS